MTVASQLGIIRPQSAPVAATLLQNDDPLINYSPVTESHNQNKDGWGIGFYRHDIAHLHKKAAAGRTDLRIQKFIEQIVTHALIMHFREATVGDRKEANTQPFRYGQWIFAQKGTIRNFRRVRNRLHKEYYPGFRKLIHGNTDGEHCFFLFLTYLKGKGAIKKGIIEPAAAVDALQKTLATLRRIGNQLPSTEPTSCNALLSNGSYMLGTRMGASLHYKRREYSALTTAFPTSTAGVLQEIEEFPAGKELLLAYDLSDPGNQWTEVPDKSIILVTSDLSVHIEPLQ